MPYIDGVDALGEINHSHENALHRTKWMPYKSNIGTLKLMAFIHFRVQRDTLPTDL